MWDSEREDVTIDTGQKERLKYAVLLAFFPPIINTFITGAETGGRGLICLSGPWSSSGGTPGARPLACGHLLGHPDLVLKPCQREAGLRELLLQKTADFGILLPFIIFLLRFL